MAYIASGPGWRRSTRCQSCSGSPLKGSVDRRRRRPGALFQLALELAGAPAGIAAEDAQLLELAPEVGGLASEVEQAQLVADLGPAWPVGPAAWRPTATAISRCTGPPSKSRGGRGGEVLPRGQQLGQLGVERAVEDHTHRALFALLADQHDAAVEVRVEQRGRGDEQTAGQWFAHAAIIADQCEGEGAFPGGRAGALRACRGRGDAHARPAEWLNAISPALDDELLALLDRTAAEAGVHVAVIRGAGRAFSSGADSKRDRPRRRRARRSRSGLLNVIQRCRPGRRRSSRRS